MRLATVSIDGNTETVRAYTNDTMWNGWLNVYMTQEQLTAWMNTSPYDVRFMDIRGKFIAILYFESEEQITAETITVDGQELTVFSMNSYCFVES